MAKTKRTPEQLVQALLEKTVGRGATADEQDAAVAKARELVAKHGLDPSGFEWPPLRVEGPAGVRTIRAICEELILMGVSNAKIVEAARAERPGAKTSVGCVSWYRSKMVKRGLIPSPRATKGTGAAA